MKKDDKEKKVPHFVLRKRKNKVHCHREKKITVNRKIAIFPHCFFLYSFLMQTTLSCKSRVPKFCLILFAFAIFLSSDTTDVLLPRKCERA